VYDYELGYIAALVDLHGFMGTDRQYPFLRVVWKHQPLAQIARRLTVFNGPYAVNERWSYLTIRRLQVLEEVLTGIQPLLIVKRQTIQKALPMVQLRAANRYVRGVRA